MEIASVSFALCAPARRVPLILALACTGALACAQRKMLEPRETALLAAAVGALWPGCLGAETLLARCRTVYERHASGMQAARVMACILMLAGGAAFVSALPAGWLTVALPDRAAAVLGRTHYLSAAAFCVLMAMQPSFFTALFGCLLIAAEGFAGCQLEGGSATAVEFCAFALCGALLYCGARGMRTQKKREILAAAALCLIPCASLALTVLRVDPHLVESVYGAVQGSAWRGGALVTALNRAGWAGWIGAGALTGALCALLSVASVKHWTAAALVFALVPAGALLLTGCDAALDIDFYLALAGCYLLCSLMTVALGRAES